MMAVEPVSIAGKKWEFMVTTPLSDVDAVVNRVFKRAIFWDVFVVCSMTAILSFGLLVPLKETQMVGRHRPAQLFRFDADKYEKLKKRGFHFEL